MVTVSLNNHLSTLFTTKSTQAAITLTFDRPRRACDVSQCPGVYLDDEADYYWNIDENDGGEYVPDAKNAMPFGSNRQKETASYFRPSESSDECDDEEWDDDV